MLTRTNAGTLTLVKTAPQKPDFGWELTTASPLQKKGTKGTGVSRSIVYYILIFHPCSSWGGEPKRVMRVQMKFSSASIDATHCTRDIMQAREGRALVRHCSPYVFWIVGPCAWRYSERSCFFLSKMDDGLAPPAGNRHHHIHVRVISFASYSVHPWSGSDFLKFFFNSSLFLWSAVHVWNQKFR